jgi:putative spermidine/putrescine transport system ATP-binding protein
VARTFEQLRLEDIQRDFGAMRALRGVNLAVKRGEFIALLGPSGCGKSTALNCLAGLLPLTGGGIWLDDQRIDTLRPEDRGFGMVFQNYALFPHMSVRQNVAFGLTMQKRPKAEVEARVDKALDIVRLRDQSAKLPGQLSGGQQQRVAIARAIVIEPRLVLMDEPLSNLDAKLRLEMRSEIRRIHNLIGATTIYVTHDQEEALSLADRIVVMRDGIVRQVGVPEELFARPLHADVADFMGYRNIVASRATETKGQEARVTLAGVDLSGRAIEPVRAGDAVVVAIRPDDLSVALDGSLAATAETCEYRGHDFYCSGVTADGTALYFTAPRRLEPGEAVRLACSPDRLLIYAEGGKP